MLYLIPISLLVIASVLYIPMRNYFNYKRFQSSLSEGTICKFFLGEEEHIGVVLTIYTDRVYVQDQLGHIYPQWRTELYPA